MNGLQVFLDGQQGASELACVRYSVVFKTLLIRVVGESSFSLGKKCVAIGIHADGQKTHQHMSCPSASLSHQLGSDH